MLVRTPSSARSQRLITQFGAQLIDSACTRMAGELLNGHPPWGTREDRKAGTVQAYGSAVRWSRVQTPSSAPPPAARYRVPSPTKWRSRWGRMPRESTTAPSVTCSAPTVRRCSIDGGVWPLATRPQVLIQCIDAEQDRHRCEGDDPSPRRGVPLPEQPRDGRHP